MDYIYIYIFIIKYKNIKMLRKLKKKYIMHNVNDINLYKFLFANF